MTLISRTLPLLSALSLSLALMGPASAQQMGSMPGMHHSAAQGAPLADLSGKAFDRAFLSMMLVHHQGAVDMSQAVLKSAKDAQVKTWTADIVRVQQREITQMQGWLGTLGGVDKTAQSSMNTEMGAMMSALKASKNSDAALVQGMLPHHASAIEMASLALQRSSDARVLTLARGIIRTQADEMYAYRQWLIKRGL